MATLRCRSVGFVVALVWATALPLAPLAQTPEAEVSNAPAADSAFPQRREVGDLALVIHAPQIRAWPDFSDFEALLAVEVSGSDGAAVSYGTATVRGRTEVDLSRRVVRVVAPHVGDVTFALTVPQAHRDAVLSAVTRSAFDVPLDLFIAHLSDEVLSNPPPEGFNADPPPIVVRSKPTLLLFVNGEPVSADVPETWLNKVVNANWPLFRTTGSDQRYYLLERDRWLTSARLDKRWKAAKSLPADFLRLPDTPEYAAVRAALPLQAADRPVPAVLFANVPTELIVLDGKPSLEAIESADGLEHVTNTDSLVFRVGKDWYYLVAGRWFTTVKLEKGPWKAVSELPEAFAQIPADHALADVRASVPGTPEARMAAFEALMPTRVAIARDAPPPVEVAYAGEPTFEPVPQTSVARAVNTGHDIIQYENRYYLLYAGAWYVGEAPTGPWTVTDSVPSAVYAIPPNSPSYHVTHVSVVESSPTSVVYSYPPSYSTSVYVVHGVPYYGTGWYYPPYVWGRYYFPYPVAYGSGSWYNPATGGYGSRSLWYGPYGGYSYSQGYNPSTGRYGYVETAWDGDEWVSYGETYNPRTGVGSETSRYYDEDRERSEMVRTTERGDDWVRTERDVDYDQGTSRTERTTSGGGSGSVNRSLEDGTLTSSGSGTTADGRSYAVSGEATREGGSSTITGSQGSSASIATERRDGRSYSTIEGSDGGQGASFSGQGRGRTTLGQSDSGDLYAGHDGNVYKKSGDGWQHYEDGSWQSFDVPERAQPKSTYARASASGTQPAQARSPQGQRATRDYSQLDRDYGARQRGTQQYRQRMSRSAGMSHRGGLGRRR